MTIDLLNQTCCECGQSGEALYCVKCVDKQRQEWVEITRCQIAQAVASTTNAIELGFAIEAICKENNGYT